MHAVGDAWTALEVTPIVWNVSSNGTCSCHSIGLNIGLAATLNQGGCFRQVWKCIWDTMACHALEEHQQAILGPNQVLQVEEERILLIWGGLKKMKTLLGRMPVTMMIGKTIHPFWIHSCQCVGSPSEELQYLDLGLWPSTYKKIKTLFTFQVL